MRRRSWIKEVRKGWVQEGEEHKESSSSHANSHRPIPARRQSSGGHSARTGHFRTNTKSSVMNALAGFTRASQLFNKHSSSAQDLKPGKKSVPSHKSPIKRSYRDRSLFAKAKKHLQQYNSHPHSNAAKQENDTNDANVAECINARVEEKPASEIESLTHANSTTNTDQENISQTSNTTTKETIRATKLTSPSKRVDGPTVSKIHVAKPKITYSETQPESRRSSIISFGDLSGKFSIESSSRSVELKSNDDDLSSLFQGSSKAVSKRQTERVRKAAGFLQDISEEYSGYSEPLHGADGEYIGKHEFTGIEIQDPYQWDDLLELSKSHLVSLVILIYQFLYIIIHVFLLRGVC